MSLFENEEYQWRETYFIFIDESKRPSAAAVEAALMEVSQGYDIQNVRADENGMLQSLTVLSGDDYAAMDLSFVRGEEVEEQMETLLAELKENVASQEDADAIKRLPDRNCRLDVFHFEQMVFVGRESGGSEPDDFMDPGALLVVLQQIAMLCDGIVVDPQANCLL